MYTIEKPPKKIFTTYLAKEGIQMSLNFAVYSGYEKRKITRKVLADKLGGTAFHSAEIGSKKGISESVMEPNGQEPVAPLVRRNPPKLQSSFANRRR